ncbi:hypothetical protein C0J52_02931 [Blattella germanica]|nr:hypothetical protein C0J52_02931 [Blattella germanica]
MYFMERDEFYQSQMLFLLTSKQVEQKRMIENITKDLAEIENHPYFEWTDYLSFSLMLTFSALIGIYFGFWGKKDDTTREYLHGGKALNVWPVAASLAVSMVSAVTFLGIPTEVYMYGTFFWLMCVSTIISAVLNDYFYLPVFFGLQLTSSYEYLELRFSKSVRIMASLLYTINTILYMPIVIYIPALVLGQVLRCKRTTSQVGWVPHNLSDEQKECRQRIVEEFFQCYQTEGKQFLRRILTINETWIRDFEPELKSESAQWISTKKFINPLHFHCRFGIDV